MENNQIEKLLDNYSTPMYVFDIQELKKRMTYLKNSLPKHIDLCYAMKANPFIVKEAMEEVDRLEVCSPGELMICKQQKIPLNKIVLSGVYKTPELMKSLMNQHEEIGIYTIESKLQFELLQKYAHETQNNLRLLLRLTSGNQFGMNQEEIREIISHRQEYTYLHIQGIQYFSGTQKTSIKRLKRELEHLDEFIELLKNDYDFESQELEFGPGFPVDYFTTDEFHEKSFLKEFSDLLQQVRFQGKIVLELGRSIAATCGSYLTRVVDRKRNQQQNYGIVDGGIHHLVYFGQSMAMKQPKITLYPQREETQKENWNLCGSLCTSNDILVKQLPLSDLQIGDVILFHHTGAYCMCEGISLFLSRDLPAVVMIQEDQTMNCVRELTPTYPFNTKKERDSYGKTD